MVENRPAVKAKPSFSDEITVILIGLLLFSLIFNILTFFNASTHLKYLLDVILAEFANELS